MISIRTFSHPTALALAALTFAACGGGDKPANKVDADSAAKVVAAEAWKARKATSDSVVRTAPQMSAVVKELGSQRYDEADAALTAAVLRESEKTRDCYTKALKELDPGLTAVLYMLVNFGAAGWDLVRVEKWTYSSQAGGALITCINARAKSEWKLPTKGIKPGAHLVKLVYAPSDTAQKK
jgi:hypothetical protein